MDGSIRQFGYVVRDGVVEYADEVDIVVSMEVDGTTYRGATGTWTFADGREPFVVECRPYDAMVFEHHDVGDVDAICEISVNGSPASATSPSPPTRERAAARSPLPCGR